MDRWLAGHEVMSRWKISQDNLIQHIIDGLTVYDDKTLTEIKKIKLRDKVFFYFTTVAKKPYAEFKPEELAYRVRSCLFKIEDIEEYERRHPELAHGKP